MIQINNTIVSSDVVSKKFVCDLTACQGECCVAGASGAPLEDEELGVLEDIYEKVEPYLTKEGKKAVKKYGKFVIDSDGDYVTPLVGGDKECAYTIFEDGMAKCGIEKAWADGVVKFRKPISCHLYPIRIDKLKSQLAELDALGQLHRQELHGAIDPLRRQLAQSIDGVRCGQAVFVGLGGCVGGAAHFNRQGRQGEFEF